MNNSFEILEGMKSTLRKPNDNWNYKYDFKTVEFPSLEEIDTIRIKEHCEVKGLHSIIDPLRRLAIIAENGKCTGFIQKKGSYLYILWKDKTIQKVLSKDEHKIRAKSLALYERRSQNKAIVEALASKMIDSALQCIDSSRERRLAFA